MRKKILSMFALFGAAPFLFTACTVNITFTPPMSEFSVNSSYISTENIHSEEQVFTSVEKPVEEPVDEVIQIPQEPEIEKVKYIQVLAEGLNVRRQASTTSTVIGQVDSGMGMAYLGKEGDFYKTYYMNTVAYVSAKEAFTKVYEQEKASEEIESVITEGCKLLGVEYVYGAVRYHDGKGNRYSGFTTSKFDCSSLMQYIFYKGAGVLLDVNTRTQIYQGKEVAKSDLKRGDLLFFTNASRYNNTGIERVGHVALYLGDNLILHTSSDYARIEQLNSTRWGYFLTARRILS